GRPYSFQFLSLGGSGARSWSVVAGTMPTVTPIAASTGRLSGNARAAGTYDFTVRATDAAGATVDAAFTVTLHRSPEIATDLIPTIPIGRPYAATLHVADGTPPFAWFGGGGALPPGISIGD